MGGVEHGWGSIHPTWVSVTWDRTLANNPNRASNVQAGFDTGGSGRLGASWANGDLSSLEMGPTGKSQVPMFSSHIRSRGELECWRERVLNAKIDYKLFPFPCHESETQHKQSCPFQTSPVQPLTGSFGGLPEGSRQTPVKDSGEDPGRERPTARASRMLQANGGQGQDGQTWA